MTAADSAEASSGGEETGPLAGRLWRRYGAAPGLISVASARRLIARASRFGAGRLSLLESIQRRFGVPGSYGKAGGPGLRLGQLPYLAPPVAAAGSAEPHAAGGMGSGNPTVSGIRATATPLVLTGANPVLSPLGDVEGLVSAPSTSGLQLLPQQGPQALQARVQARLRLPLTAHAVQAKTAGRESMALAGEIVERRRSGALERALQQAPEVMRVAARAAPVDRPERPPGITDRELRRAVAPAGAASDQPGPVATTGAAGGGAQSPAPGVAASDAAARGPQATGQPVETARPVTPVLAGDVRQQGPAAARSLPVVRAVQEVRRSPAGAAAGGADRSAGVESTGAGYRQARQDRVARRAVEPVTPRELPVRAGVAGEVRRETSAVTPPLSTGGRLPGTGGQAGSPGSAPRALGAVIAERSLSLSHVQRAPSADPLRRLQQGPTEQGTLVHAAAVTRAAGRAMMQPAALQSAPQRRAMPGGGAPAPDTAVRRTTAPGAAQPGSPAADAGVSDTQPASSPSVQPGGDVAEVGAISAAAAGSARIATSPEGMSTAPSGGGDLPHVRPGVGAPSTDGPAQSGPAEGTSAHSQPAGRGSGFHPQTGGAGSALPLAGGRGSNASFAGARRRAEGPGSRSSDSTPGPRGELPVVQLAPAVQVATVAGHAAAVGPGSGFQRQLRWRPQTGGQLTDATGGSSADGWGRVEAQMPVTAAGASAGAGPMPVAVPIPAVMRQQRVDAVVAQGITKATAAAGAIGRSAGAANAATSAALRHEVIRHEVTPAAQRASLRDGAIGPHVSHVAARSGIGGAAERGAGIARLPIPALGAVAQGGTVLRLPVMRTVSPDEVLGARALGARVAGARVLGAPLPVVRAGSGTGAFAGTPDIGEVVTPGGAGAARAGAGFDDFGARRSGVHAPTPTAPLLPHLQLQSIFAGGAAVVQTAPRGEVHTAAHNTGSQMIARKTARSSGSGPDTVLLQRDGDVGSGPAPVSESPTTTATTADQGNGSAGVDLPRMADQVYELIRRRLIRERESLG